MSDERKRAGAVFWVTMALILLSAYPATFGPACWLVSRDKLPVSATAYFYQPFLVLIWKGPMSVGSRLDWYAKVGAAEGSDFFWKMSEATDTVTVHRWKWSAAW
jgi:hypothetical protein